MPIIKKISKIGTGYAVFLPKSWVECAGYPEFVLMEIEDHIIITPYSEAKTYEPDKLPR